jgi:O-antigen/teichoic acid export membrane protein
VKTPDFDLMAKMLKAALPFGMLVGFSIVYNKVDVVILQHYKGYAETGLYTAAYKFFDLMAFFPGIVSSALYPYFSYQIQKGGIDSVRNSLQNYTRYMIALAVPIAVGGALVAPKLITVIGGSDFYQGFVALQILVFASAALFIYAAVNSLMINQLTKYALVITVANVAFNVIGNIIFVPTYGLKAAAIMTLLSEVLQAGAYFYFVRTKIVNFHVLRFFTKPLLAALVMGAVLYSIRMQPILLTLPIGVLVYSVVIFLTGFFKPEDIAAIKRLVSRKQISI